MWCERILAGFMKEAGVCLGGEFPEVGVLPGGLAPLLSIMPQILRFVLDYFAFFDGCW